MEETLGAFVVLYLWSETPVAAVDIFLEVPDFDTDVRDI